MSRLRDHFQVGVLVITIVSSIASVAVTFYVRGIQVMEQYIDLRLASFSAIAAEAFDESDLENVRGEEFINTDAFFDMAYKLEHMRIRVPSVSEASLLRFTDTPGVLEHIVSSRNIFSPTQLDTNKDAIISAEEDVLLPGELVYISIAGASNEVFSKPLVSRPLQGYDQRTSIVGYAPIRGRNGSMIGVVSFQMDPSEYKGLSSSLATPLILLVVILFGLFLGGFIGVFFWKNRSRLIEESNRKRLAIQAFASHQLYAPLLTCKKCMDHITYSSDQSEERIQVLSAYARLEHIADTLRGTENFSTDNLLSSSAKWSLTSYVEDICAYEKERCAQKNQTITVQADDTFDAVFSKELIAGIVRELLDNVFYYAGEGAACSIILRKTGSSINIECTDNGAGIDPQDMDTIFHPFSRGNNAQQQYEYGLGMGLHIVKSTVEVLGGHTKIQSTLGTGTTVTLNVPLTL